jgi:hypothetical protein
MLLMPAAASAATFTVTTAENSGPGSLRAALEQADNTPNNPAGVPDRVEFAIPGAGPHVIRAAESFEIFGDAVVIDGYTQAGARANTLAVGTDAVIQVQLDCSDVGDNDCMVVGAANTLVTGLSLTHAGASGVHISEPGVRVEGNSSGWIPPACRLQTATESTSTTLVYSSVEPPLRNAT